MDEWVDRLNSAGPEQNQAIAELGDLIRVRIGHAFRNQPKVDASFIDDVVQDSLTSILNSIDQFEGRSQFLTWATTLAVRLTIRQLRKARWKDTSLDQMLSSETSAIDMADQNTDDPASKASSEQMVEAMYRIINNDLTEKQREVLLAHLNGMPQAEIGRRMGTNRNAIYKLGFDARKRLKEGMEKAGYSAGDLASFGG